MIKRIVIAGLMVVAGSLAVASKADAGIYIGRIAPVRRVAAHAVLPPYPIVRPAIVGPIYRPVVGPVYRGVYGARVYGGPVVYGSGVSVSIGY